MFDDLHDLLPEGAVIHILSVKDNGDVLVNVKADNWQLGYTGQDPAELLERAWDEQTTYEAQQAIKAHNKAYKDQLRALSEQNKKTVATMAKLHQDRKATVKRDARANYIAKRESNE